MDTHIPVLIVSLASLAAVLIVCWTMLRAWRDWLALQHNMLKARRDPGDALSATARIELAALKDRVRKLEAIASGVDLLP
jgi:hypothetical protein